MWQTILTILGTLAGASLGIFGIVLKARADRRATAETVAVEAIADLVSALGDHRTAMWDLEAARSRKNEDEITTTLAASLVTRSAMSRPHVIAKLRVPALAAQIDAAVRATYDMDSAVDPARAAIDPVVRKDAAKAAELELIEAAGERFVATGIGLALKG
ncbi:hypothetical protein [Actinosynnema mirum]|uniref:Uncharacterized protein n=1 Tax=Actinosynnema mirum (strain ATCC 29888 / DSM 43827 / JCM 3225 / NBRC 14064 / NCIMB 13271 / NRRL B-12336 / IMRU 3971 / 101) TaxID=446462 RepID=C6WBN0_ACTMD|nr:hypothetical protein [Actinosynnema mirum]ACU35598.1 hypothetical protein Amir_1649 [Actinosynnema mirum DSM 43827]